MQVVRVYKMQVINRSNNHNLETSLSAPSPVYQLVSVTSLGTGLQASILEANLQQQLCKRVINRIHLGDRRVTFCPDAHILRLEPHRQWCEAHIQKRVSPDKGLHCVFDSGLKSSLSFFFFF